MAARWDLLGRLISEEVEASAHRHHCVICSLYIRAPESFTPHLDASIYGRGSTSFYDDLVLIARSRFTPDTTPPNSVRLTSGVKSMSNILLRICGEGQTYSIPGDEQHSLDVDIPPPDWILLDHQHYRGFPPKSGLLLHRQCWSMMQAIAVGLTPTIFYEAVKRRLGLAGAFLLPFDFMPRNEMDNLSEEERKKYLQEQAWRLNSIEELPQIIASRFHDRQICLASSSSSLDLIGIFKVLPLEIIGMIIVRLDTVNAAMTLGATCKMMRGLVEEHLDGIARCEIRKTEHWMLAWTIKDKQIWIQQYTSDHSSKFPWLRYMKACLDPNNECMRNRRYVWTCAIDIRQYLRSRRLIP